MTQLPLPGSATDYRGADLSDCGRYRYALWRTWDVEAPLGLNVLWIMLNPSTADGAHDDATIRRCVGFARAWGYGGIRVVNLFAYRATHPRDLWRYPEPIGPRNDAVIYRELLLCDGPVIAAWGALPHGRGRARAEAVAAAVRSADRLLECLGRTQDGHPRHPVRLPRDVRRERWCGYARAEDLEVGGQLGLLAGKP